MNYKITQANLVGEIEGFPIKVVEKMIERQVEQGFEANVKVFQRKKTAGAGLKGFSWNESREGQDFWHDVIMKRKFDIFFAKYPERSNHYVYIKQDGTKKGSDVIETLASRGGVDEINLGGISHEVHYRSHEEYYYIHPTTKMIRCTTSDDIDRVSWLKTFYTEIDVEPSIKEYTMQEIADKLGIDVANLRIKK